MTIEFGPQHFAGDGLSAGQFAEIDVAAGAAALFFDFGNPVEFVRLRFQVIVGIVIPGNGVEARALGFAARQNGVGGADDRRGIQAAAEFRKNGAIGAQSAADSSGKKSAEMLSELHIGAIADFLGGIEIPVLANNMIYAMLARPEANR